MFKKFALIPIIFSLILFTGYFAAVFAGDNIPSDKEVAYAQSINKLMKEFNTNETGFLTEIKQANPSDNVQLKKCFTKKFAYTKAYYTKVKTLVPTSKFVNYQQKLLEAIYGNLQYMQKVIAELDTGKSFQSINAATGTTQKAVQKNYNDTLNTFNQIINSWQKQYVEKVIPPESVPKKQQ